MELKDRIVQAALEVFGEYGYEKATIAQIVERAGSSKGGFYHHFEGKKQVLEEISSRFYGEIIDMYNQMLNDTEQDTIYILNHVFSNMNEYKKQMLPKWKELTNMYFHEDSYAMRQKMAFEFIDLTAGVYEKLLQRGMGEGLFRPQNPKALAGLWSNEITRLYSKVTEIVMNNADSKLCDEFAAQAQFVEDTINHALNAGGNVISIKQPAMEYLDMAIEMMKKVQA